MPRQFFVPGIGVVNDQGQDELWLPGFGVLNETTPEALLVSANLQTVTITPLSASGYYVWSVYPGLQELTITAHSAAGVIRMFRTFPVFPPRKTLQTQPFKRRYPIIR